MTFDEWWETEGSGILPIPDEDMKEHAKRVSAAAWEAAHEQGLQDSDGCFG